MKTNSLYLAGILSGALAGLLITLMAYAIMVSIAQGGSVVAWLLIVACMGMIIGAMSGFVVSEVEKLILQKR